MKRAIFVLATLALCARAEAQFGGLLEKAQKAQDAKKKLDSLNISDEEEQRIGAEVSLKLRTRFGVVQDAAVHKYVTLVGTLVAQQSDRPKLPWTFIVLDTDGVNAFAAPGGYVHITRGALGLAKNEAELAAVLGHEVTHVAHRHTIDAIRKANAEKLISEATLSNRGPYLDRVANFAYDAVLEGKFDRGDELDADKTSVALSQKIGYAPAALADFLARLDERNKDQRERNGLFASHPETKERIEKIRQLAGAKAGPGVQARYASNIRYEAPPLAAIAAAAEGSASLAGSDKDQKDQKDKKDEKKDEPKSGLGLGGLKRSAGSDQQSTQVSASGGARGVGSDRLAKGGDNPNPVKVSVSAAEVTAFRQGIA
jgi:predicted Zn-dependent protease